MKGGGDELENGLEVLVIVLKLEWENGFNFVK